MSLHTQIKKGLLLYSVTAEGEVQTGECQWLKYCCPSEKTGIKAKVTSFPLAGLQLEPVQAHGRVPHAEHCKAARHRQGFAIHTLASPKVRETV